MKKDKRCGHQSMETRIRKRNAALLARGKDINQASEMLDLFLGGDAVIDIAEAYNIHTHTVYASMSKEALFRLMRQRQVERLEEVKEIVEGDSQ